MPDVIYSGVGMTKGGNEDYVGNDGSYIKIFSDVLVDQVGQQFNH